MRFAGIRSPFLRFAIAFTAVIVLWLAFQPHFSYLSRRLSHGISAEEYAVYSAVIEEMVRGKQNVELVVIGSRTSTCDFDSQPWSARTEQLQKEIPDLSSSILSDFRAQNGRSYELAPRFAIRNRYVLLSASDMDGLFAAHGGRWEVFYERYPKSQGIMEFSRVGFDFAMSQALVYIGNQYGELGGAGGFVFLAKEKGAWTPRKYLSTWVS